MENMADALRIAAGVLLAILLVSLLVYIFRAINAVEDEKQQQILIEQVKEFNDKFLAYDKNQMYGTDVMSVISLAINNNRDINTGRYYDNRDGRFYTDGSGDPIDCLVNIKIILSPVDKIKTKTYVKKIYYDKNPPEIENPVAGSMHTSNYFSGLFNAEGYLDLRSEATVTKFSEMILDETKHIEYLKKRTNHGLTEEIQVIDNYGIEDFKKSIFRCEGVKYNDIGRIYEMTFISDSTYD